MPTCRDELAFWRPQPSHTQHFRATPPVDLAGQVSSWFWNRLVPRGCDLRVAHAKQVSTTATNGTERSGRQGPATRVHRALDRIAAGLRAFEGSLVSVHGFVSYDFEGTAVYISETDYLNSISANALWLDFDRRDDQDEIDDHQ